MKNVLFKRTRAAARPYILLFSFLFPLSSFLFTFAVTYRVDPAGGPETLAAEVKEAFDAWVALSDKIEVDEAQENPEGVFQYGASERFGPDTLSLTVQRQTDTRSIIYLISPNAENRKRILLHETGIAIGLTPQIPGTPAPPATTPTETTPSEAAPAESSDSQETSDNQETFETTPSETTETDTNSNESSGGATEDSSTTESTDTTTSEFSEQTTDTQSSEEQSSEITETTSESSTSEETETPSQTLTENSVMNPSISPDDRVELGEVEKQLVEQLQLFVSEDINRDGAVNFYDLVALAQAFGRSGVNDPADINKDGVIDQSDVDELQKSYTFSDPSQTAPGSSTAPTENVPPEGTGNPPPPSDTPQDNSAPSDGSGE